MKRSVLLSVALSVFILSTGCRKPQEISEAQCKQVMAVAREEFAREGLVHGGVEPFIRIVFPKWLTKKNVFVVYTKKPMHTTIPRMAIKHSRIKRTARRVMRKACRKAEMPFREFDAVYARYGKLKLTYSEERKELESLLVEFSPVANETFKEKEQHNVLWNPDSATQARLDPDKFERACWLAVDLGLPLGGEYRILIEINEDGETYINGELVSLEEYVSPIAVKDPYRLVYLMPDPQLPAGKLSTILNTVGYTGTQRVVFSDRLSQSLVLKRPHYYPPTKEFVERAVLVEIMADDRVRINNDEIENPEASLDSLIKTHFVLADIKFIVVLASQSASCGMFIKVGFSAKKIDEHVLFVPEGSIRPASERRGLYR